MDFAFDINVEEYAPPVPDSLITAPGTWTGTTCGADNNCILQMSEDFIYQVTIPNDSIWIFSLCNSDTTVDSWMALGSTPCSQDIAFNDDMCGTRSQITTRLTAGTYYLTIEAYDADSCFAYTLDISEAAPPPANDLCVNVIPTSLPINTTLTFNGNNTGALNDCDSLISPQVWEAFTTTETLDVTVDYCGTVGYDYFAAFLVDGCPCGTFISPYSFNFTTCIDSNVTMLYHNLPPGTHYIPVVMRPAGSSYPAVGPYTIHVTSVAPAPPPPNDLCSSVTPASLLINNTLTFTGDNTYALNDCDSLDYAQVWEAFTTTETLDVTVDYCGTVGYEYYYTVLVSGCPCGSFVYRYYRENTTCVDSAMTIHFHNLPPGTYYIPILLNPTGNENPAMGPYTIHVKGVSPAPPAPNLCLTSMYSNGVPTDAGANATQCDPYFPFAAGVADDFILPGVGSFYVDTVVTYISLGNGASHPIELDGIVVTMYKNNAGLPGGQPIDGDTTCAHEELITGGIISSQSINPGAFTYGELADGIWQINIPIAPVLLTAGTTYWLEVQPILSFLDAGQSYWINTDGVSGYGATQIFPLAGIPTLAPINPATDMAFCLKGTPGAPPCNYLIGDINGDDLRGGGDVTYGVRFFKLIGTPPKDSCLMDSTSKWFYVAADVNGNCEVRGSDITRLVAYFKQIATLSCCHWFPTTLPPVLRITPSPVNQNEPVIAIPNYDDEAIIRDQSRVR
jgi:hypothetical protein